MAIVRAAILIMVFVGAAAVAASDWPYHGHNAANHRYSPLRQINEQTVADLQPAWCVRTGKKGTFQATPIVVDGTMYVSTPFNDVLALAADDGRLLWRYRHDLKRDTFCCGPANRGTAVADGLVYMATLDARLIALDAHTGDKRWEVDITIEDTGVQEDLQSVLGVPELKGARVTGHTGASANMAPQVVAGLVLVGITGAGYGLHMETDQGDKPQLAVSGLAGGTHGLRGFIAAYDAATGEERWRWYSVPSSGWEGKMRNRTDYGASMQRDLKAEKNSQRRYRNSWRYGGGSVWTTPAVDEELGLVYLGTGNPSPQMEDSTRPGDNLYTVSLVALNLADGSLRWHYQQVPHDRWGYDVASPPVLFELNIDGRPVPVVGQASKLGWFFVHDRRSGELLVRSQPFIPQENLFARPTEQGVRISPGTLGAVSWSPVAWNEASRHVYIAGIHQPSLFYSRPLDRSVGPWTHISFFQPIDDEKWGNISAIDPATGEIEWQRRFDQPLVGGVLATAGGLVLSGEGTGRLMALDSDNGHDLWSYTVPYGVNAPPISYEVNNRQYIAVAAGGNRLFGYATGDLIMAFALPADGDDKDRPDHCP